MGLTGIRRATKGHVALLGHLMYVASYVASQDPLLKDDGYRIVVNDGKHGCKINEITLLLIPQFRLIGLSSPFACDGR